jgi:transposase-like protein
MGIRQLQLRTRIAKAPRDKRGVRQYPAELRAEVQAYAQERAQKGVSKPRVAKELGLPKDTLYGWVKSAGQRALGDGRRARSQCGGDGTRSPRYEGADAPRPEGASPRGLPAGAIAFHDAVAALGQRARTTPYPAELRAQAMSYVEERKSAGTALSTAAGELGVGGDSLRTWTGQRSRGARSPALRSVVRAVEIVPEATTASASSIIVHGPRGLRIEGLDVGAVAVLVKELSC